MFESRSQKHKVEEWIIAQDKCPSRKETQREFPNVPQRLIRAALQSRKDSDRRSA